MLLLVGLCNVSHNNVIFLHCGDEFFNGFSPEVFTITWPEKILPGTAVEIVQTMAADSKAWAHTLKCNHVVPCFEIVFPVGLESFWDLQLSVSTVGMGLAFLQWSLNL